MNFEGITWKNDRATLASQQKSFTDRMRRIMFNEVKPGDESVDPAFEFNATGAAIDLTEVRPPMSDPLTEANDHSKHDYE